MKKRIGKNLGVMALAVIMGLFALTAAAQQTMPKITATLTANPASYNGTCPAVITFKGRITVTNLQHPLKLQYKFIRSDGAHAPIETVTFDKPGAKEVSTTWTLGGAQLPSYTGWEAIKVVYPQDVESNKARFKMQCRGEGQPGPGKLPDLVIDDMALDKNCQVVVRVKNIGTGPVPDQVWTVHKPESAAVYLSVDGKGWGGETIWKFDAAKALKAPGGTAVMTSTLRITGAQSVTATVDHTKQVVESNDANNTRTERLTCQAAPQAGGIKEDCVSFNPATATVANIQNDWKIVDGNHWMFSFGQKKDEADRSLAIIKHYRMNRSCFVGRPDPSFQYMLVSNQAPAGAIAGEDCVSFNPATAAVANIQNDWKIVDGNHWMFSFGNKEAEARQSLAIIKQYGFARSCFVGRPGPSFKYLKK
jgi:hypothetical protein